MLASRWHATELLNTEKCIRGDRKMPKLNRYMRELLKDELIDDALQTRLVAALQNCHGLANATWSHRRRFEPYTLLTPYGMLTVSAYIGRSWTVARNGSPLVCQENPRKEAVFSSIAAAKAAGLVHLRDGFGSSASEKTRLRWQLDCPTPTHVARLNACNAYASVPDEHECGQKQLECLLLDFPDTLAADIHVIRSIERQAESWELPMPKWTRRARGWYELSSPYGVLIIRRLVGWTVERNNEPLRWCYFGHRVIFDKLEHAQISAVVHAYDVGLPSHPDGTHWSDGTEDPPHRRLSQLPAAANPADYFRSKSSAALLNGV